MKLSVNQLLQQGVIAHKGGNLEEAERLYRAILITQPMHPDGNHNLGLLMIASNNFKEALPLLRLALQANSKVDQFWLSYIDLLIKENDFDTAKGAILDGKNNGLSEKKIDMLNQQLLESKNQKHPPQSQINSLKEYCVKADYVKAEILALSITQKFPNHEFSWTVLGLIFEQTNRLSDALNSSQNAVKLEPKKYQTHFNLGVVFQRLNKFKEAEASYFNSIALKHDYSKAHFNLGIINQKNGKLKEAEASYSQAISFKPDYIEAFNNRSVVLSKLGKNEDSQVSSRQAIILNPYYPEAHNNLGIALQELGKLKEAEESYCQAIILNPKIAEFHYNLGNTQKELGRLKEAEESYRKAIILNSSYVDAYTNLGIALQEMDRLEEAEESYNTAIKLEPKSKSALVNRWKLLYEKGEYELALKDSDLCDTKISSQRSLVTLYALGQIEEIYKRIKALFKSDSKNIEIAAFSAFLSSLEKKPTANNFCNNPMDLIYYSNISSHIKNSTLFINDIITDLLKIESIWEPSKKSTRKGFQTPNNINLFASHSKKIKQLKSIIINELDLYYTKFKKEPCSFIQNWPLEKNLFGWHVILKQQGYQNPHIHTSGWLSGVIYLKVVPPLEKDEGAIEFSMNGENYSNTDSPKLTYQPNAGDIVFFPSSLHHRTIPFTTDTDRIIFSFDLMPGNE